MISNVKRKKFIYGKMHRKTVKMRGKEGVGGGTRSMQEEISGLNEDR